jgi:acetyltransferase-like isoleucine patch superfamily enzyme
MSSMMNNKPKASKRGGWARTAIMGMRRAATETLLTFYRRFLGMDIGSGVGISLRAKLDFTYPRGIHIGDYSYIAFGAVIFAHDMSRLVHTDTYVGSYCFIGANAIVLAGVRIGDHCIVGSGSVVTRDVPDRSIVVGNPARIVRSDIDTVKWGILADIYAAALEREAQERKEDPGSTLWGETGQEEGNGDQTRVRV